MTRFDVVAEKTLKFEGGYVNDPADPGGETNRGITIHTARRGGYKEEMKDLSEDAAKDIYKRLYWNPLLLDNLHDPALSLVMFDTGVNMGISWPVQWLQAAINLQNARGGTGRPFIMEDGMMGPQTVGAANMAATDAAHGQALREFILNNRLNRYRALIQNNPALARFDRGWKNRVTDLRAMQDLPEMQMVKGGDTTKILLRRF